MIAVRFNGWSATKRYRGITPAACSKVRHRWTIRAQIWGVDGRGHPARFSATLRTPKALRFSQLSGTINNLLNEVGADMHEELGGTNLEHVSAGWLAVSESPRKKDRRSR